MILAEGIYLRRAHAQSNCPADEDDGQNYTQVEEKQVGSPLKVASGREKIQYREVDGAHTGGLDQGEERPDQEIGAEAALVNSGLEVLECPVRSKEGGPSLL